MDGIDISNVFDWYRRLNGLPLGFPVHISFSPTEARTFIHTFIAVNTYDNCHGQPDPEALKSKPSLVYQSTDSDILQAEAEHRAELHAAAEEQLITPGFPLDAYNAFEALVDAERHQMRLDLRRVLVVTDAKGHLHTLLPIEVLVEIIKTSKTQLYPLESLTEEEHRKSVEDLMDLYSEWMVCTDLNEECTANETCFDISVILQNADLLTEFTQVINRDRKELIDSWNSDRDEQWRDQGIIIPTAKLGQSRN